jgi:hypothetical protein
MYMLFMRNSQVAAIDASSKPIAVSRIRRILNPYPSASILIPLVWLFPDSFAQNAVPDNGETPFVVSRGLTK